MTAPTKTPAQQLETVTWLLCANCGGKKTIPQTRLVKGAGSWVEDVPCPSCQDASGVATGLLMPGLTEECPIFRHEGFSHLGCVNGRIPRRHDALEAVETALNGFGEWQYEFFPVTRQGEKNLSVYGLWGTKETHLDIIEKSPDRKEAAIGTLYAALVAKGVLGEDVPAIG